MVKVAIVTGAVQGISFAIVKRLYEDDFKVGILDYNQETAEKAVQEISPTEMPLLWLQMCQNVTK